MRIKARREGLGLGDDCPGNALCTTLCTTYAPPPLCSGLLRRNTVGRDFSSDRKCAKSMTLQRSLRATPPCQVLRAHRRFCG